MDGHISDDELSRYSYDPESFPAERQAQIQRHLAGCTECDAHFDFYTVFDEDLSDPAVWQPFGGAVPAMMSAYARECEAEDKEAERLLKPYLANPTMAAFAHIRKLREFCTGGVVRRLNAQAHAVVASKPMAALTFADLAQAIAALLPNDTYPRDIVYELRGTAWKERANALLRLGDLKGALESLHCAEQAFRTLNSPAWGLAAVELVRAAVYYQLDELPTATMHAERAEHRYAQLGLEELRMKALHLRGSIKYLGLDVETASAIFQQVIDFGKEWNNREWVAKGSYARANCELDRGNLAEASMLFHTALVIFREIGPLTDRISTEWGLARVFLHGGRADEAARRLREVMTAFEKLGMGMDAALVGLDLADALLVLQQPKQIAKLAAHSFEVLKDAGVLTCALAALAYLQESAAEGRLSSGAIQEIRTFLRRAERNPELIFVPPPGTPD